jgi:hypothetical protein
MSRGGRNASDKDKAKMSLHNFSGKGDGECEACGLPRRNTVHSGKDYQQPPGEGYTHQQAREKADNAE